MKNILILVCALSMLPSLSFARNALKGRTGVETNTLSPKNQRVNEAIERGTVFAKPEILQFDNLGTIVKDRTIVRNLNENGAGNATVNKLENSLSSAVKQMELNGVSSKESTKVAEGLVVAALKSKTENWPTSAVENIIVFTNQLADGLDVKALEKARRIAEECKI